MSSKNTRSGGKYSGNHTTIIPAAAIVCDIAHRCESVTRISSGFIKAGLKSVSGKRRVKITERGGAILLAVRDNTSHQELYVYADDSQGAKIAIARGLRDKKFHISFGK